MSGNSQFSHDDPWLNWRAATAYAAHATQCPQNTKPVINSSNRKTVADEGRRTGGRGGAGWISQNGGDRAKVSGVCGAVRTDAAGGTGSLATYCFST